MDRYRFVFGADDNGKYVDEYKNGKRISCVPGINDMEWVKYEDAKGLELQAMTLTEQSSKTERTLSNIEARNGYIIIDMPAINKNVNVTWLSNDNFGRTSLRYNNDHPIDLKEVAGTVKLISDKTGITKVACDIWEACSIFNLLEQYGLQVIELRNQRFIKWDKQ